MCVRARVHACVYGACVRACVRACVCVCVCVCVRKPVLDKAKPLFLHRKPRHHQSQALLAQRSNLCSLLSANLAAYDKCFRPVQVSRPMFPYQTVRFSLSPTFKGTLLPRKLNSRVLGARLTNMIRSKLRLLLPFYLNVFSHK